MFYRLKQEKFHTHILIFSISGILMFTFLNILFPLAVYGSLSKSAILGVGFTCGLALNYFLYDRFFRSVISDIKAHWLRNGLVSLIAAFLIISLSPSYLPYHPDEHEITIETNSPQFGFSHVQKIVEDGPKLLIEPELFQFSGAWNHQEFSFHQGTETGVIEYKQVEYVREHIKYAFAFAQSDTPTAATITIDGEQHVVEIEALAAGKAPIAYGVEIIAPENVSYSRVWHLIVGVFPYLGAFSIFITMFLGISYILARKESSMVRIAQVFLFVVLGYLFWLALNFQNDVFNYLTQTTVWMVILPLVIVFIPALFGLVMKRQPQSGWILLLIILLIGISLRIYWVVMVPTAQVSDFGRFHHWALQIANNEPGVSIDRYADFTRALSLLYRIFPTHVAVEVLNIFYSAGTIFCIYWIGKLNQREKAGLIAAYWMTIYLPHISMTSIVNTDIPAVFFLVLSVLFTQLAVLKEKGSWWYLAVSGAAFALCTFVRGAMLLYLPMVILILLLRSQKKWSKYLKQAGVFFAAMILASTIFSQAIQLVKTDDLVIDESRYLMWPLVKGVNIEKLGRENPEDTQMVLEWPSDEVNRRGFQVVMERIFSESLRFYHVLSEKFDYQFANAAYGVDLAFYDETHEYFAFQTGWNSDILTIRENFAQIAQYSYLILLGLSVWASLHTTSNNARLWMPAAAILFCAFATYTFFEVQPRYARPIIPFLFLLAALAFGVRPGAPVRE